MLSAVNWAGYLWHGNAENLLAATDSSVNVSDFTAVDWPQVKVSPSTRSNVTLTHTAQSGHDDDDDDVGGLDKKELLLGLSVKHVRVTQ